MRAMQINYNGHAWDICRRKTIRPKSPWPLIVIDMEIAFNFSALIATVLFHCRKSKSPYSRFESAFRPPQARTDRPIDLNVTAPGRSDGHEQSGSSLMQFLRR